MIGIPEFLFKVAYPFWAYWQFFKPQHRVFGTLQIALAIFSGSFFASLMNGAAAYLLFFVKSGGH